MQSDTAEQHLGLADDGVSTALQAGGLGLVQGQRGGDEHHPGGLLGIILLCMHPPHLPGTSGSSKQDSSWSTRHAGPE